ncbi:dihydrodipicolinate synthase family protein [Spirosoma oryzicola]|uniref:dihydrodipicolinate synthase family protein n=1 Tax=Spirosoma oryzicola TaxID=2898794 RepID=UPI001E5CCF7D|nr:dihydrodipicolinate synthase family protein [Spirosoma oryzicola]UHG93892.1 dihydrodipicolinate synthase family protein [Spirosoma oryzicola]
MSELANSTQPLPYGLIPVMLTPFLDNGAVDYSGLHQLTDYYLNAGAAGLFANCLSSEMYELTDDERLATTRQVVQQAGGRVPVVATGTFGGALDQQADFVKRIYDTGVQAVIVITGQLVTPQDSDQTFLDRIGTLLDMTPGVPLGLYECPVPYKRLITADILAQLLPTGRLIYHKDTSLDEEEVKNRLAVAQGYNFGLYDAYMVNAVSSLRAGAAGLSCIQANIFPELLVWLCNHVNDPDLQAEVDEVQQFLVDCMDLVHSAYPTIAKYALQQRGLPISLYTRRQVEPLTDNLRTGIDQLLAKLNKFTKAMHVSEI